MRAFLPTILFLTSLAADAHAADGAAGEWGLAALGVLILFMPIVLLLSMTVGRYIFPAGSRMPRRLGVAVPVVQLGLYVVYEMGIPASANIRIDLLLILPAIAITLILMPIALMMGARRPRGGAGQSNRAE